MAEGVIKKTSFLPGEHRTGRKKGQPNLVTHEMRLVLKDIAEGKKDEFLERMNRLDDKEFCDVYLRLCKFVIPTLQAVRVDDVSPVRQSITFKLQSLMSL